MSQYLAMHWDGTITAGNVISLVVFVLTIAKMHVDNRERLVKIETKMDIIWDGFQRWLHGERVDDTADARYRR